MFNPDKRVNIHNLTIEEPEQQAELPFDPERDITEEDWKRMEGLLEHYKEGYNKRDISGNKYRIYGSDFSDLAMEMKILGPTKDLDLDQAARECMKGELGEKRTNRDWGSFSNQAMNMKIIDPTKDLGLNQTVWKGMREQLEEYRREDVADQWKNFSAQAMEMKILDPKQDLDLDEATWQHMGDELEYYRNGNYWEAFAHQAMMIKILDPEYDLKLDQVAWQGMRDKFEELRQGKDSIHKNGTENWKDSMSLAMDMKILAAEEVKVTDKGLEIKMRRDKPLTQDTPPLPETKKF